MARNAMRAARALNWAALGWMALGAVLMALWILGPARRGQPRARCGLFARRLGVVLLLIGGASRRLRLAAAEVVAQRGGEARVALGVGLGHATVANIRRAPRQAGLTR